MPGAETWASTDASAMVRLRVGLHVPLVARPTWRTGEYTGTAVRQAAVGTMGGSPCAACMASIPAQSTFIPTSRLGGPPAACSFTSAAFPTKRPGLSSLTKRPRPIS